MNKFYVCQKCGHRIRKYNHTVFSRCPLCRSEDLELVSGKRFKKRKPYTSKHIERDF
jgi:Zn finger protein HypA/HybF involved in hydrogenase expression